MNIIQSQFSPSLLFSIKHFFIEVFYFSESTAELLKKNIFHLSIYVRTFDLHSVLSALSSCLIESRVKEEEFRRRQLLREIHSKFTKTQKDRINSFTKLCTMYDLITVYFLSFFHSSPFQKKLLSFSS